jgi:predicted transcriptional regulator YdeE
MLRAELLRFALFGGNLAGLRLFVDAADRRGFIPLEARSMPKFHVQRSTVINDNPENVFAKVADFGTWTKWSPWLCAEPDAEVVVSEDASSIGSTYSWKGEVVGQGEMEHRKLEPGRLIDNEIRFVKPFKSKSDVTFEFESAGGWTKITWHMNGSMPWFLFWMVPQMEVFIGMDYERGLKMLKELIETGTVLSTTNVLGVERVGPLRMAGISKKTTIQEIGSSMEESFCQAAEAFNKHGLPIEEAGISVYHFFDMKAGTFDYTAGWILPESAGDVPAEMSTWSIPTVNALRVDHLGSYDNVGNGWSAAHQYARYKKLKQSKVGTFEIYRNDPGQTEPADLQTEIYLPLK